jgi:hypothetical protein
MAEDMGATCRGSGRTVGGTFGAGAFLTITKGLVFSEDADAGSDFARGPAPAVFAAGAGRAFCTLSAWAISALGDRVLTATPGFLSRACGGIWIFFRTTTGFASARAWLSQVPVAVIRKDNMVSEMMPRSVFIADRFCFLEKGYFFFLDFFFFGAGFFSINLYVTAVHDVVRDKLSLTGFMEMFRILTTRDNLATRSKKMAML